MKKDLYVITKRSEFPKCLRDIFAVRAICIGGCITGEKFLIDDEFEQLADAHSNNFYDGTICLKFKYLLKEEKLLLHEAAHVIANKIPHVKVHGKEWKIILKALGGSHKSYQLNNSNFIMQDYTYGSK